MQLIHMTPLSHKMIYPEQERKYLYIFTYINLSWNSKQIAIIQFS